MGNNKKLLTLKMSLLNELIFFFGKPILIIAISFAILEYMSTRKTIPLFYLRKILHIIAVSVCAYVISLGKYLEVLQWIFFFASLILFLLLKNSKIKLDFGNSYGICLFPFAFFMLLFFDKIHFSTISVCGYILAFADAFAGIVGFKSASKKYKFLHEDKSLPGCIAFSAIAFIIVYFFIDLPLFFVLISALMIGISEIYSFKGSDNFTIPIFSHLWLSIMPMIVNTSANNIVISLLFFGIGGWFVLNKKWLDQSALIAACFVGIISLFTIGIRGLFAPLYLLIIGSLVNKLFERKNVGEKRNARQVFANGLIGAICYLFFLINKNMDWLILALTSFGISICDTLSSEIGRAMKGKVIDVITLKEVQRGISGGISFYGSFGGFAGLVVYTLILNLIFELEHVHLIIILGFSFSGMLTDSLIGSKYQPLYFKEGQHFESEIEGSVMIKGVKWMSNDMVNFTSNLAITFAGYLILL